ncbi:VOC family protein [Spongiivirga citrea]|uniref:VOC family protein n=1 Tax=Spongiivirga citrea TaxID=1481457 RepID=A0A6M0CGU5_9FLAO|nr:VOC family protein [Spongiivirga citrea]NER17136.1 VOC family protein [Spongiivirga citrea]
MKIIARHQQVMPFLLLYNADAFIDFTRKIFNAQEMLRTLNAKKQIQHSEIMIGNATFLLAEAESPERSTCSSLYIYVNDTDATYYKALDAGCESLMTPIDEENGKRAAGFKDPFGNSWWLATLS